MEPVDVEAADVGEDALEQLAAIVTGDGQHARVGWLERRALALIAEVRRLRGEIGRLQTEKATLSAALERALERARELEAAETGAGG